MYITARQLEDLHKSHGGNGHVTLPYRARLTPLAADFVRSRKLILGYGDVLAIQSGATVSVAKLPVTPAVVASIATPAAQGSFLWWCDGPCGPAKAAIVAEEKQSAVRPLSVPADARQIVTVVKAIAVEVKAGRSSGGVLLVQNAASAIVFANRCPSLRAIIGSCLEAVEQGVTQVAANVLVIEYPHKTLQQTRNMLTRFLRAPRSLSEEVRRQFEELASCG